MRFKGEDLLDEERNIWFGYGLQRGNHPEVSIIIAAEEFYETLDQIVEALEDGDGD